MIKEKKMKKNILYYMAVLTLLATACSKEDMFETGQEAGSMKTETLEVTYGDADAATRAEIRDDGFFYWSQISEYNKFAVHVNDGKYYEAVKTSEGSYMRAYFQVTYPDTQARDAFAIYPAYLVAESAADYGQSGRPLAVSLPGSYTWDQVSNDAWHGYETPCPMISSNAAGSSLEFKQLCGMLRITVKNLPQEAKTMKFDFNGKKVQGDFSIPSPVNPGTSTIATRNTNGDDDVITITHLPGPSTLETWINLPLPTGEYDCVDVTAYDENNQLLHTATFRIKNGEAYTASRARGKKCEVTLIEFSVSDTRKVVFSPGNLQWQAATSSWRFAPSQWAYIGNAAGNTTDMYRYSQADWIDLFGWGTSGYHNADDVHNDKYSPAETINLKKSENYNTFGYGPSTNMADKNLTGTSADYDWGVYNAIRNGGKVAGKWRTLSSAEWNYLLNTRSASTVNGTENARYTQATINTDGTAVNGMILFPDSYTIGTPDGVTWGTINEPSAWGTQCTTAGWAALEAAGCAFLPVTGRRGGTTVDYDSIEGNYWSTTYYSADDAYYMYFVAESYNSVDPEHHKARCLGNAVRLVRDL